MNALKAILRLSFALALLTSCATTNRTKTFVTMALTGLAAGTAGALAAPSNENQAGHAVLWGGIGASAAAVVGQFLFNEQSRSDELLRQNETLKKSMEALNGGSAGDTRLLYETSAPFGKEVPPEYRALVKPGRWSVYQLNQWIMQGENTLIHQDKMIKLLPPGLNPNVPTEQNKETHEEP